jgi:hypothetical protein
MSGTAKPLRAALNVTKGTGKRFAICPACTAVNCPIAPGASGHTCAHCRTTFELTTGGAKNASP